MQVETFIEFSENVKVEISAEEIVEAIRADPYTKHRMLRGLNNIGEFLQAVTDDLIKELTSEQRKIVANLLKAQSQRYT